AGVVFISQVYYDRSPVVLTSKGVNGLHRGAVIVDCAASGLGGNVEGSVPGTTLTEGGVTILGCPNLASEVASTASKLLSRNLADTLAHFLGENGGLHMDMSRELDRALIVAGQAEEDK
ncbi:MAG: NAD(P) transhydrogenase subunit alpha, partial [Bifidobacterium crudilactis]|nr:NAD(P) transhydrogenase subunit alpha [Bifidobacterium crudilactis]